MGIVKTLEVAAGLGGVALVGLAIYEKVKTLKPAPTPPAPVAKPLT